MELSVALGAAAKAGALHAQKLLRTRRPNAGHVRHPRHESPMWSACAALLRAELHRYGEKSKFARYLGVPRQRLNDYLTGRSRLPDAELTLRMLHWLTERRAGRDPAL